MYLPSVPHQNEPLPVAVADHHEQQVQHIYTASVIHGCARLSRAPRDLVSTFRSGARVLDGG
eukprot:scaffold32515_cov65-Phaeocystis_antarctica.AAC.2